MLNIVIFGAPGSGKGTQSDKLIEKYRLFHISTGDVLRDNIKRGTELGAIAKDYIDKGQLIPDDLMVSILADVLDANREQAKAGVIFDGFPRTIAQAQALDAMLAERGTGVTAVVGLEVPEDELVQRILLRGKLSGRADDNLETVKNRLDVYHNQTAPLRDYYQEQGLYRAIEGMGAIDDIFGRICAVVDALDACPGQAE
ncbi:MAG: adenylate kinase [Muribaculaceae bacterium]|nr:adenylate kinase [Muribaculaceae bacterium]